MDPWKSVGLWLLQGHGFREYHGAHTNPGEQAWGVLTCWGAKPAVQRCMGGGGRKDSKGVLSQWLDNPIYTPPEQPPPVDNIRGLDCPLRTVAKHLSRVSSQSFDRSTVGSPGASSSVCDSVRITGDQGLVWSCNPIFADDLLPGHLYSDSSSSRASSRIPCRIASRSSRISSAFELEQQLPLPRIRTYHERDMTEDSARNLATGALSVVSPVVSGFYTGRTGSRDFDSACQNYRATAEWLNPECSQAEQHHMPKRVERGGPAGPDRDSCMEDLIHEFQHKSMAKIGKLKEDVEGKGNEISLLMDMVSANRSNGARETSLSKLGQLGHDIKEKEGEIDFLLDVVAGSDSSQHKISWSTSDAVADIQKLRKMIQQQDMQIATLYQDIAREIAALAKMGSLMMVTPRASVPWDMSGPRVVLPLSAAGAAYNGLGCAEQTRCPRAPYCQDSLEKDTLSRLEVQVQVLAEQLHMWEGQYRQRQIQLSSEYQSSSSSVSSDPATVITHASSVVELPSENESDLTGYEVVINPFFEGLKTPVVCDSATDYPRFYEQPFAAMPPEQSHFCANEAHMNSVIALQQLVAESDAEIAALSAQLSGNGVMPPQLQVCPVNWMDQNGVMLRNPVFDSYSPCHQGVVVG